MDKILLVDDDEEISEIMGLVFSVSFNVLKASNPVEAINLVHNMKPELVIIDFRLKSDKNGFELANEIKSIDNKISIFILTGSTDINTLERMNKGIIEKVYSKKMSPYEIYEDITKIKEEAHK